MELDLELPSYEQEKLETGSIADDDVMDDTDMIQVEDEDVNSPTTSEPVEEGCRPIACNTITGSGDQVDVNMVGANVVHKGVTCEPKNGLEFESKEAAYSFYREYARSVGFGITIKASRRSKKSGKFIDVKIACSRFGSKRESSTTTNPRSCPKTGCKAGMHMKKRQDEKWVIYSFVKEHNHDICPDDFCHAIRGRNKQSGVLACQKKHLQLVLDDGDLEVMLEHFMCMKDENPNFFYAIDLDNEKCLRNVFWVDAKGRHDYSNFYDVVFFDTFYVKNKYKIPCVPIIGVNHHFQFILLGCALIGDENASSFVWLMRTWLKAVSGQAPKVIITDQDKILNEAVADVFPNTRHCFCLWQNTFLAGMSTPERSGSITSFFDNSVRGVLEANTLSAQGFLGIEEENCANSKAKSSKKKKMYKKRKVNSEPERMVMGLQDSCQQMEQMHSRAHTLTNSYVTQQNRQEMEASRAPILDSYYAYQQNLQGVGQLDSISPIRDVYYANQQDMQGLGQLHSMSAARVGHYGTQQSMQGLGQLGFRGPVTQGCFNIQESLQDMDHSAVSAQFNSITSKHLHEKHLSR
ncbi:hypothetical protein Q3G72_011851 [Acer saccharum]|nr:hypothetical protein Q3G72_011851 [Acer saccharum]